MNAHAYHDKISVSLLSQLESNLKHVLRWRDMRWCGQTVACWLVAKFWATCASDRVVLCRVQLCRLLYTDAQPSLCVHSIPDVGGLTSLSVSYIRSVRSIRYLVKIYLICVLNIIFCTCDEMAHIAYCDGMYCDQNYCDESPVTKRLVTRLFVTKRPAFQTYQI